MGGMDPYAVHLTGPGPSEAALTTAARLLGPGYRPAIMLHGVMPRSGTVFVGELLRAHPDLHAYPNDIWELPFLEQAPAILDLQAGFFDGYGQNRERMGDEDFLPIFGSALLRHLETLVPADAAAPDRAPPRLLLKEAGVRHLRYFPRVFPKAHLLLLLRDGRDLVNSTMRTWPDSDFATACERWAASTRAARAYFQAHRQREPRCMLVRFEDVVGNPEGFVRDACAHFDLDPDRYPYHTIDNVPVIGSSTLAAQQDKSVDWQQHQSRPADYRPSGHWDDWPERWKKQFQQIAGDELAAAGYRDS